MKPYPNRSSKPAFQPLAILLVAVVALVLAACAGAPPAPVDQPGPPTPEQAFARGQYETAARQWQELALNASGAEAASLRISAADAWLLAGQPEPARDNLRWIDRSELDAAGEARMNVVLADLALREDRPDEAETLLGLAGKALPSSWRDRHARLLAETQRMLSQPGSRDISQARDMSESLDRYQPDRALQLLQSLEGTPSGELAWRANNPRADRNLTGWLDLALVIRQQLIEPSGLEPAIEAWKGRHAFHPLSREEALDLWLRYRQQFVPPSKVAVLLPESGRFEAAGKAIRDGIVSAYLDNPAGAEIVFLPTGEDPQSTPSAYFEAREQGAQWIVGPLQPEAVESLLGLAGLATPVLALNTLPPGFLAPAGLQGQVYGVSLSHEDEVRAIARAAIEGGLRRAVILAPESSWGERMASVFSDEFLREDTEILASSRYLESENDHSAVLERLLMIDESRARAQRLENTLQVKLEYAPVRRDDVDLIFLAANPVQGRQLRPQLRFHSAGDLPVYATSRIYTGIPDRARDQDLDGIRFPITPLQLGVGAPRDLPAFASLRGGTFASLYALGADAWNILPWLEQLKRDPDFRFPGASGTYRAGLAGNLVRETAFAEFRNGRPVPVPVPRPPLAAR
jgi:hypothetical protein